MAPLGGTLVGQTKDNDPESNQQRTCTHGMVTLHACADPLWGMHAPFFHTQPGPPLAPLVGAAGKLQSRNGAAHSGVKKLAPPASGHDASKVTGLGPSPPSSSRRAASPGRGKAIAGRATHSSEVGVHGTAHTQKKQSKPPSARASSPGHKRHVCNSNTSSVDSVVFGTDVDGSKSASEQRDFSGAAGTRSGTDDTPTSLFSNRPPPPLANRASADELI